MRIALIGPLPPEQGGSTPGGVATHQAHLAARLAALPDVEVALLATNAMSPLAAPYTRLGMYRPRGLGWLAPRYLRRVGGMRLVRYAWHLARSGMNGSRSEHLAQLLWYRSFLAAVRPEVVHVQHPLERLYVAHQVAQLEGRRWPLVVTAHSFFGEHAEDVIHEFMAPNLRVADRVIAVSPHIADQAMQLGVASEKVRVIRSGIDVERYQPRDRSAARRGLRIAPDVPLILFVGNLEPRKQVDVLLRALARAAVATLVVVGSGDEAEALRRLAAELGVADSVRFEGRVEPEVLLQWYAAADVFALPSSSEAQGIVALEAMACGLPVVASAVGGLWGTIDDGETGYLVPSGEVEPLASRLSELLARPEQRAAIGTAARAKVSRDFTWYRAVQATVEVYRELVECPKR